ncbi:hypothetical protein EJ05DRAFT_536925 [Pseudovirgaria hyperparasitica]|uniref:Ima1 N-terminal domain-containing protein n=1 Tax=Pseudovirgaria hyperparasitica TaxID=470096 RepID=A0A6A6WC80_9PEZI|nr:uncharacterized protein EJ05DRAFT_536925 [Pseudovirgaria hyperparasitica]KAF2759654.1 hypothetical protein EJ05DRAFT_536925 [Pseudovirgaria hyperparasitica]
MPLLRRGPICHGCQQRSSQALQSPVRQFQCEHCEALNYFDEHGDIADPPPQVTDPFAASSLPSVQYAYQVPRPSTPLPSATQDTLFCADCVKNQQYYTDALSNYLPPPDDPSYEKYEAAYNDWKRSLEERYPQVCATCLPRVRQKLKDTRYATITEDLRRKMLRSKHGLPISYNQMLSRRGVFYILAGAGWWLSILSQLAWHALGLLIAQGSYHDDDEILPSTWQCGERLWKAHEISWPCFEHVTPLLLPSLLIGFLCCWWHPTLIKKMHASGGRMKGQKNYLQLQLVTLTIRLGLWRFLREPFFLTPQAFKGAHTAALAFLLIMIIASIRAIHIDYTPRFTFKELQEPAAPKPSPGSRTPATSNPHTSPTTFQPSPLRVEPFPITKLAPTSPHHSPNKSDPESSPDDDDDNDNNTAADIDEMDWTPTRRDSSTSFRPSKPLTSTTPFNHPPNQIITHPIPSPFFGTLPSAPLTPAHRARNPPQRPLFKATPLAKQQDFFTSMMLKGAAQNSNTRGSAQQQQQQTQQTQQQQTTPFTLTPATLNLAEDPVETGLESIFDNFFTIADEPAEVRAVRARTARSARRDWWAVVRMVGVWISPLVVGVGVMYAWAGWRGGGGYGDARGQVGKGRQMPVRLPLGGTWVEMDGYGG